MTDSIPVVFKLFFEKMEGKYNFDYSIDAKEKITFNSPDTQKAFEAFLLGFNTGKNRNVGDFMIGRKRSKNNIKIPSNYLDCSSQPFMHRTLDGVCEEIRRLRKSEPDSTFVILQTVKQFKAGTAPIKKS